MAVPALRIPVALDMQAFKAQSKSIGDGVEQVVKTAARNFDKLNGELIGIPRTASLAIARFAALGIAGYAAFKLISASISLAKEELKAVLDISEKAQDRSLSPTTYQAFTASAKGAEDQVKKLDDALSQFYQNSKSTLDISVAPAALDDEKRKWTELETAVRSAKIELGATTGPDTFIKAFGNEVEQTDQRLLGTIQTIQELFKQGQRLEALNIIQKGFGASFADDVRRGKTNFDDLARTVEDRLVRGLVSANSYSDEIVTRAKQIDDRLNDAWRTINVNLHPSFENLADTANSIKGIWADIVGLMAKASGYVPSFGNVAAGKSPDELRAALADVDGQILKLQGDIKAVGSSWTDYLFGGLTAGAAAAKTQQLAALQRQAEQLRRALGDAGAAPVSADGVPLPRRRPIDIPQPGVKDNAEKGRDSFDRSADTIEKRTAALKAEALNIDQNTQARERAKIVAELQTVAMQANAAAGLGEGVITAEQTVRINQVADAYSRAVVAMEQARSPLATFGREAANVDKQLQEVAVGGLRGMEDAFVGVARGTQTVKEAFHNMANSIIDDLIRMQVRRSITGPLSNALNSLFTGGASLGSGGEGLSLTGTGGLYADGGVLRGPGTSRSDSIPVMASNGEYIVNAQSTGRFRELLDQINSGTLSRFANGGMVSYAPTAEAPGGESGWGEILS